MAGGGIQNTLRRQRRLMSWAPVIAAGLVSAGLIGTGVWRLTGAGEDASAADSARMATMLDIGRSLRRDIQRQVEPAIRRTEIAAADPAVVGALQSGDPARITEACNAVVVGATEIDAFALFDAGGDIVGINTVYEDGSPIDAWRIDRIMAISFQGRDIIQSCTTNSVDAAALEFQTQCDITPAFFDSTGLSVAYSLPVLDPETGENLGVVSSRVRFERLTALFVEREFDGNNDTVELVTDWGGYFSEEINAGAQPAPIPMETLAAFVAPLVAGDLDCTVHDHGDRVLCLFRLRDFEVLEGGGLQVLLSLDDETLLKEVRQEAKLEAMGFLGAGVLILPLGVLVRMGVVLRDHMRRAHDLVGESMDAVIAIDERGRVCEWNEEASRVFGFEGDEVEGRSLDALRTDQPGGWLGIADSLAEPDNFGRRLESKAIRADGSEIDVEYSVSPIVTSGGIWSVAYVRDITEQKQRDMMLAQAQKLESIGQLAAGIAHEINTPTQYVSDNTRFIDSEFSTLMGVVESYDELLDAAKRGTVDESVIARVEGRVAEADFDFLKDEIPQAVTQSLEGLGRIATIVAAMKDFSHPGTEAMEPADLNKAIESTTTVCRSRWKYCADLDLHLDPTLPETPCKLAEFNQAILNLVVNAADAIAERFEGQNQQGRIEITTRGESEHVVITVSDNGGGIPESIRAKVFDPFFTTKGVGKGTGQGLAISREVIVTQHGGELSVAVDEGEGTTFTIRLPLEPAGALQEAA